MTFHGFLFLAALLTWLISGAMFLVGGGSNPVHLFLSLTGLIFAAFSWLYSATEVVAETQVEGLQHPINQIRELEEKINK